MGKTRKSEKAVEIHEFFVVRTTTGALPSLCEECPSGDAYMFAPEQAAAMTQVALRNIYRAVETGSVHYKEGIDGLLVVCLKSLTITRNQQERLK